MAKSLKNNYKMEVEKINQFKQIDSSLHGLARAFTISYSCCYLISPLFGLQNSMWGPNLSAILLVGVGLGLIVTIFTENKYLLLIFGVAEAAGCVAHFLHIVPWIPVFSDTAYIIMSLLDLTQSFLLFTLLQSKK